MTRLLVLLLLASLLLTSCRYLVLYEFAEQFCEFDDFVSISLDEKAQHSRVLIRFMEPVLDRSILLRYLNAAPVDSIHLKHKSNQTNILAKDKFALGFRHSVAGSWQKPFNFELNYHSLDEHALLESAWLDSRLSQLFSPVLVEALLRSLCSDDFDLSLKQLDMRFSLSALPISSLPSRQQLISVFGQALEARVDTNGEQSLNYQLDFLAHSEQHHWQAQDKPIIMSFIFDRQDRLKSLYIHYYKYSYWLNVETSSGRLLVIRHE